jgi:hypothetical protein
MWVCHPQRSLAWSASGRVAGRGRMSGFGMRSGGRTRPIADPRPTCAYELNNKPSSRWTFTSQNRGMGFESS